MVQEVVDINDDDWHEFKKQLKSSRMTTSVGAHLFLRERYARAGKTLSLRHLEEESGKTASRRQHLGPWGSAGNGLVRQLSLRFTGLQHETQSCSSLPQRRADSKRHDHSRAMDSTSDLNESSVTLPTLPSDDLGSSFHHPTRQSWVDKVTRRMSVGPQNQTFIAQTLRDTNSRQSWTHSGDSDGDCCISLPPMPFQGKEEHEEASTEFMARQIKKSINMRRDDKFQVGKLDICKEDVPKLPQLRRSETEPVGSESCSWLSLPISNRRRSATHEEFQSHSQVSWQDSDQSLFVRSWESQEIKVFSDDCGELLEDFGPRRGSTSPRGASANEIPRGNTKRGLHKSTRRSSMGEKPRSNLVPLSLTVDRRREPVDSIISESTVLDDLCHSTDQSPVEGEYSVESRSSELLVTDLLPQEDMESELSVADLFPKRPEEKGLSDSFVGGLLFLAPGDSADSIRKVLSD